MKGIVILTAFIGSAVLSQAEDIHFSATNLWSAALGRYSKSSPALGTNGVIYALSLDGKLSAFDPDGSRRWVFNSAFETVSTPAIGNHGGLYFGSRDRQLYAVTAAGRQEWKFKTGGWVDAAPALATDGTIYFGSWDKKFYAVSPDGAMRWEFVTGGPVVSSAVVDASGNIYFGSHDRKLYALNPDGSKRWDFATRGPITSSPAIGSEGEVYFTSVDGNLYALNSDGSTRWSLRTGGITTSSPVLGLDGTIFISVNQTHCAITPDGKFKWQRAFWHAQPGQFGETAAAVLADNTVVFTGGDGFVMTVPGDNGEIEWHWNYWLFSPSYSSPLVAPNGTVYVLGQAGQLHALHRVVPPASSPWPTFRGNAQRTGRVGVAP